MAYFKHECKRCGEVYVSYVKATITCKCGTKTKQEASTAQETRKILKGRRVVS